MIPLTTREKEVLLSILDELTNGEIATKLNLSIKTVEKHRQSCYVKLNTDNSIGLIKNALREGVITLLNLKEAQHCERAEKIEKKLSVEESLRRVRMSGAFL